MFKECDISGRSLMAKSYRIGSVACVDLIVTSKCHLKKISIVDLPNVDLRVHCVHLYKDSTVPGHCGCLTKVIFHHPNPEQVSMEIHLQW